MIGELSNSTDSDAELCPDMFLSSFLVETMRDSVRPVGAIVTAVLELSLFTADASKNEPVNEPHKLLADVPVATEDKIGLLTDCFMTATLSLFSDGSGEHFSAECELNDDVVLDAFIFASPYSSSLISNALSMVFCASFKAVLARLAIPVASNQLISHINKFKAKSNTVFDVEHHNILRDIQFTKLIG